MNITLWIVGAGIVYYFVGLVIGWRTAPTIYTTIKNKQYYYPHSDSTYRWWTLATILLIVGPFWAPAGIIAGTDHLLKKRLP